MKKLLTTFILGIIFINNLTASPIETENCGCDLQNKVEVLLLNQNLNIPQQSFRIKDLTDKEINDIALRLCAYIISTDTQGFKVKRINRIVAEGIDIDTNDPNINSFVSVFLNKYKNKLICPKDKRSSIARDKHLFKEALWRGVIDLFDEMLFDDENYTIDFNAYEIVNGKKETVLDFIEVIRYAGRGDPDELDSIKDVIIELGGKYGYELKD